MRSQMARNGSTSTIIAVTIEATPTIVARTRYHIGSFGMAADMMHPARRDTTS